MQTSDNLPYLISQGFSPTIIKRFWPKVKKTDGCWTWTGAKLTAGYGYIGKGSPRCAMALTHRVSWIIHFGPIPDGHDVLHECDNPPCIRPDHLFTGTHLDNMWDKIRKGRHRVPYRITPDQVREIRQRGKESPRSELAEFYKVSLRTIYDILSRRRRYNVR